MNSHIANEGPGRRAESVTPGRKLRLLVVITRLTVGGDTNVVLDIARRFRDHPLIEAELAAGPVAPSEVDLTGRAHERRIPTHIIAALSNRPDPRRLAAAVLELRALMRRGRYDIVHTHSSVAGVAGRVAAMAAGIPVIVHHVHGWGLQEGMSRPMRVTYLALERLCALWTDRLIAVSRPTIDKGLAYRIAPEDKFALIYNGIDVQEFRRPIDELAKRCELGLDPDAPLVGMIGRLDRQKNPLDLIRAAALVVRHCPRAQFLLVGDGSLRAECERLIAQLGLQHHCVLLGFRQDVAEIMPLLAVVASTSLWEGLPVVFQEAMSAGKPIVANDVDGVSDIVHDGQTGYLVAPHDPQQMADRVLRLLKDERLRRALGERAREESASFAADRMLDQMESLYLRLATNRLQRSTRSHRIGAQVSHGS